MTTRARVGVLVSGRGSNLQALLDACAQPDFPAEISVVISNVEGAYALERARSAGVPTAVVPHQRYGAREQFEEALVEALSAHRVELVCLAGFMRLLGARLLRAYPGKVLNIHPSLLPSFPGMHAARQALSHGVKITGCTVHLVDEGTDSGPILIQAAVPILPEDDESSLAARILEQEHRVYPLALRRLAERDVAMKGRTATIQGKPVAEALALRNPGT